MKFFPFYRPCLPCPVEVRVANRLTNGDTFMLRCGTVNARPSYFFSDGLHSLATLDGCLKCQVI